MPSIAQEDILGVKLGADFLTEPNEDRSLQVSQEELGCFYNNGEKTESYQVAPCYPGIAGRMVGIFLFRSGRRLNVRWRTCPSADISGYEGPISKCFKDAMLAVV
jgi:hypothetical protein